MFSNIEILGKEIPLYGLCFYLGIAFAALAAFIFCKYISFPRWEIVYSGIYTMIGAFIGSKLLFIIVSWQQILTYRLSFVSVIKGGFVFYGGLIGGLIGLLIYTGIYKEKTVPYLDIYAMVLPLGHAIGRVGCFFAGCCYGIPCSFGVVYTETVGQTPIGIKLLPIQLIEAGGLLIIFAIQLIIFFRRGKKGSLAFSYCFSYSLLRFVTEFFRGDSERGEILFLSTSQWICVLLLIAALSIFIVNRQKLKPAVNLSDKSDNK